MIEKKRCDVCVVCKRSVLRRKMQNHMKTKHPSDYAFLMESRINPHKRRLGSRDYEKLLKGNK